MAGKLAALVATGLVYIAVWIPVTAFAIPEVLSSIMGGALDFTMPPEFLVTALALVEPRAFCRVSTPTKSQSSSGPRPT